MTRKSGQPRSIILCADDYGMNAGVNRAIRDLAMRGRISATSCMTNAPGWEGAARDLIRSGASIGLGLHFTLTWGRPIGPMPDFAIGRGEFPPLGTVLRRAVIGRLPRAEIRAEIERQLDRFIGATGRTPDFVDGHQHVHALPGIRQELLAALTERRLTGQVWLRDPSDETGAILARRLAAPKALFVKALSAGFAAQAAAAGFACNRGFSGFSPFDAGRDPEADFARYLERLGPQPLVMCHPGAADPSDEIAGARVREYEYLSGNVFPDLLLRSGVDLVSSPV